MHEFISAMFAWLLSWDEPGLNGSISKFRAELVGQSEERESA